MPTIWDNQDKSPMGGESFYLLIDAINFLLIDDAGHKLLLQDGNDNAWRYQIKTP